MVEDPDVWGKGAEKLLLEDVPIRFESVESSARMLQVVEPGESVVFTR